MCALSTYDRRGAGCPLTYGGLRWTSVTRSPWRKPRMVSTWSYHLAAVISIVGEQRGLVRSVNVDGCAVVAEAALNAGVQPSCPLQLGARLRPSRPRMAMVVDESSPRVGGQRTGLRPIQGRRRRADTPLRETRTRRRMHQPDRHHRPAATASRPEWELSFVPFGDAACRRSSTADSTGWTSVTLSLPYDQRHPGARLVRAT